MDLQEVLWLSTALGAFLAFSALVLLVRGRGREPGVVALVVLIGALLCAGGFLLSIPLYAEASLIAGGAAVVGLLAGAGAAALLGRRRPKADAKRRAAAVGTAGDSAADTAADTNKDEGTEAGTRTDEGAAPGLASAGATESAVSAEEPRRPSDVAKDGGRTR